MLSCLHYPHGIPLRSGRREIHLPEYTLACSGPAEAKRMSKEMVIYDLS